MILIIVLAWGGVVWMPIGFVDELGGFEERMRRCNQPEKGQQDRGHTSQPPHALTLAESRTVRKIGRQGRLGDRREAGKEVARSLSSANFAAMTRIEEAIVKNLPDFVAFGRNWLRNHHLAEAENLIKARAAERRARPEFRNPVVHDT